MEVGGEILEGEMEVTGRGIGGRNGGGRRDIGGRNGGGRRGKILIEYRLAYIFKIHII